MSIDAYFQTTSTTLDAVTASNKIWSMDTAAGAGTDTLSIANGDGTAGTADETDYAKLILSDYTITGGSGAQNYTFNLLAGSTWDSNVTVRISLARYNSSETLQSGWHTAAEGYQSVTATATTTWTWTSLDMGTWASTDRLGIRVEYDNASTHGGDETVTVNIAGTYITAASWTQPVAALLAGSICLLGAGR